MTPPSAPPQPPAADAPFQDALAPGTRFFELEVLRVLGVGGFGIVYLARDHALERDVALKEYMPAALASRTDGSQVTVRSGSFADTYAVGLRSFVNEAKLLARFDHPSLVKVYRFWEANGTAYMVMPYLQGRTLREARRSMATPPDERWIRAVFDPVLDALERLHREEVFHRDIAPDNILLPDEGPPVLLDFGAARQVISGRTQSLTAILKPSYAPIEQYAELAHLRQGPWTDIYALGAVMHYLLYGSPPSPATARAVQDDLGDLGARPVAGVSPRMLAVVAWALAVRPQERPQDVATLRSALDGRHPVPEPGHLDIPMPDPAPSRAAEAPFEPTIRVDAGPVTAPVPAPTAAAADPLTRVNVPATVPAPPPRKETVQVPPPIQPVARSRGLGLALGVVGVALAVVLAGWAWRRPARAPAAPPTAEAVPAPAPMPAPATSPVAEDPRAAPVAAAVAAPPATDTAASAAAVPPARAASRAARPRPVARSTEAPVASATPRTAAPDPAPAQAVPAPAPVAPPPVATPAPAVATGPATAREACGKRVFLALARCMEEQCENPRFAGQRDCLRVIEMRNRRDGR